MQLFFDLDAGIFVTAPGTRETLTAIAFKRGDTCSIAVQFLSGVDVQELASGAAGRIGMKANGDYDGDYIAADTAWTKTGTGTTTLYTFDLNLATTEIDTLLTGHTASITALFEMEFLVGSVRTSSNTVSATILNDVNKGDETAPLVLPTPEVWLETERPAPFVRSVGAPENGSLGTCQSSTWTVVAGSGCTSNGAVTATLRGLFCDSGGTEVAVNLTTLAHTSASLIAAAIRAAMGETGLGVYYTFAGTGAEVKVTAMDAAENDPDLLLTLTYAHGITGLTATSDTFGVAPVSGDGSKIGQVAIIGGTDIYILTSMSPKTWIPLTSSSS